MQNDKITPFKIDVTQEALSDLQLRLKNTRWSYQMGGTGWDAGTDLDYPYMVSGLSRRTRYCREYS
jgi:hypothetical protein